MAGTSNTAGVPVPTRRTRGMAAHTGEQGSVPLPQVRQSVEGGGQPVVPSQVNPPPQGGSQGGSRRSELRTATETHAEGRTIRSEDTSAGHALTGYERLRRDNEELRRTNEEVMRTVQSLTTLVHTLLPPTGVPSEERLPHSAEGARQSNPREAFSHRAREEHQLYGSGRQEETAESTPSKGPVPPALETPRAGGNARRPLEAEDVRKMIVTPLTLGYPQTTFLVGQYTRESA